MSRRYIGNIPWSYSRPRDRMQVLDANQPRSPISYTVNTLRMKPLVALGLLSSVILAQTFRSTTTLVRAEALVEENGHVVTGLQSEDFIILDEDQPQPVANFGAESGSIRLVLLLDASGSMQPAARQLSQTGLAALSVLHPDDVVALMTFDKKATLRVPLTADRNAVMAGVSKV